MMRYLEHRLVRMAGYAAFFAVLFSVFLVAGFPAKRFTRAVEYRFASMLEREVRISEMDVSMLGNLVLSTVEIAEGKEDKLATFEDKLAAFEDTEDGEKPPKTKRSLFYLIDEAVLDIDFFGLLFDHLEMEADLEALGGELSFYYEGPFSKGEKDSPRRRRTRVSQTEAKDESEDEDPVPIEISAEAEGLQLSRMPDLARVLKVPVKGEMECNVELESDSGRYRDANGEIEFRFNQVGLSREGHEADTPMGSIKVPPLQVESIEAIMKVEKGVGTLEKFVFKSKHLDVTAEGTITFADPLTRSQVDIYLTFKLQDAYLARSDSFKLIYSQLETFKPDFKRAKRDDGYYGFRYRGAIGKGRFSPQKQSTADRRDPRKRSRRNVKSRRSSVKDRRKTPSLDRRPSKRVDPMENEMSPPPPIERRIEPPIPAIEPELEINRDSPTPPKSGTLGPGPNEQGSDGANGETEPDATDEGVEVDENMPDHIDSPTEMEGEPDAEDEMPSEVEVE